MGNIYELKIKLKNTIFYTEETNFGVFACTSLTKITEPAHPSYGLINAPIIVVGIAPRLIENKVYEVVAESVEHPSYGYQYKICFIKTDGKLTQEDEHAFMANLVSPKMLERIINNYKFPVTAIRNGEFDYKQIKRLSEKKFSKIKSAIDNSQNYMEAFCKLSQYGLSFKVIKILVDKYTSATLAINAVNKDPYILYREVKGVGFKKADIIAKNMNIPIDSYYRILSGIIYCLELEENFGHTWSTSDYIKKQAQELLELNIDNFNDYLSNKLFYYENNIIAIKKIRNCELDVCTEIMRVLNNKHNCNDDKKCLDFISDYINFSENKLNIKYSKEQQSLFYEISFNNFVVLTGCAGSGKTFLMNGCLDMLGSLDYKILLASPTARAAKVLSESTGKVANTIHRVLHWTPEGFLYNARNKLKCDVLVVDEAGMLDIYLFRSLLEAVPDGCKVILIGDPAQLESISVGNILYDLINSNKIPLVQLSTAYRQALDSGILAVANEVNLGIKFYNSKVKTLEYGVRKDFKLWISSKEKILYNLALVYNEVLNYHNRNDILIISPMKKGDTGVISINKVIQHISNPADETKKQITLSTYVFRVGDKVRHTKNDYNAVWYDDNYNIIDDKLGVFNGDIGMIIYIDSADNIFVDYNDKIIKYIKPYNNLELAYAITCHSSQGSQSKVVIGCLDTSHYLNLKRNLLYTMITRASRLMVLVADVKALNIAISKNTIPQKRTFLKDVLLFGDAV